MKITKKTVLACLLILVFAAGIFAAESNISESIAVISDYSGDCKVKKADTADWVSPAINLPVYQGDEFKTGSTSFVEIIFDDASIVRLSDNSNLKIDTLSRKESAAKTVFNLLTGKIMAIVDKLKNEDSTFEVRTKMAIAAVKGTEFAVEADDAGNLFGVLEGSVQLRDLQGNLGALLGKGREAGFKGGKFTDAGDLKDMMKFTREFNGMREEITIVRKLKGEGKAKDYYIKKKMQKEGKTQESETEINVGSSGESGKVGEKVSDYLKKKVRKNMLKERTLALNDLKYVNAEMKADLHLGKTMTDVHGNRVRIEEYVFRPAPDQVDLLSLSFRDNRLDYLRVNTTFNRPIPETINQAQWKAMWQYKWDYNENIPITKGSPQFFRKNEIISLSNTLDRVDMLTKFGIPVDNAQLASGGTGEFNFWFLPKTEFMLTINDDIRAIDANYASYSKNLVQTGTGSVIIGPNSIKEHKNFELFASAPTNAQPVYNVTKFADDKTFETMQSIPYTSWTSGGTMLNGNDQNYTPANDFTAPAAKVNPGTKDLAATQTRYYNDGSTLTTTMWLIDDYGQIMKNPTSILDAVNLLFNTNVELNLASSEFQEGDIDVVSKLLWWIALNPNGKN